MGGGRGAAAAGPPCHAEQLAVTASCRSVRPTPPLIPPLPQPPRASTDERCAEIATTYRNLREPRLDSLASPRTYSALLRGVKVHASQAATLFLIAPMIAVSMAAPPAPPAIACEMMPPMLRSPDCAAAVIAGSNNVTIWPSTPPPIKPEIMLPMIPRSKVGDDLPTPTPPRKRRGTAVGRRALAVRLWRLQRENLIRR